MKKIATSEYTFVRDLTPPESAKAHRVGLYATSESDVVIKQHESAQNDHDTRNMQNEAIALKLLNTSRSISKYVHVPQIVSFSRAKDVSQLVMSVVAGTYLDNHSKHIHIKGLEHVLNYLQSHKPVPHEDRSSSLPVRSPSWYMVRIVLYAMREILETPRQALNIIMMITQVLKDYVLCLTLRYEPVLTHGGLYTDSILYDDEHRIYSVIDWESAHYAHPAVEVSALWVYQNTYLDPIQMNSIIVQRVKSSRDLNMYFLVGVYYLLSLGGERLQFMPNHSLLQSISQLRSVRPYQQESPYEYVHHLTFSLIARLLKWMPVLNSYRNKVILCYHSISDSGWRYATSPALFSQHVAFLMKRYTIVPLHAIISGDSQPGSVAITFDDAYSDVYRHAFPILEKAGVVATVFALGSPERSRKDELENEYEMMSDAQLKKLAQSGWEIGYHTDTHPDLHTLSDAELRSEIHESKERMENRIGLKLRYFAYPKGKYSAKIIGIVKEAGYEAGLTVDGGKISLHDAFAVTRLPTEGALSIDELEAQMTPLGLMIGHIFMILLRIKERLGKLMHVYESS